jgi:hypothetical protein
MDTNTSVPPPRVRSVWFVQAGIEDDWRPVGGSWDERELALNQLEWARAHAPRAVRHRLVRETTSVVTEIETV